MSESTSIHVNFGRPMPLFPLDQVALLPQQVLPLHIFEPRYRQMVDRALDAAGQIAIASFQGAAWKQEYHGNPPVRPAVCVGQIAQHEKLHDGRYNILLQGVCRARIVRELPPAEDRLYREAMLEPLGVDEDGETLYGLRERLEEMLAEGPLAQLAASNPVLEYVRNGDIPVPALLELVSFTLLSDQRIRYRLLEEGSIAKRADLIEDELHELGNVIARAESQRPEDWPKGCSWN